MNLLDKRLLVPIIIGSLILFLGNSSQPPSGNTGAPFDSLCSSCHGGGGYDGDVTITGFPSTITPNMSYSITIKATATVGNPVVGGFQLVCVNAANQNSGTLTAGSGNGTSSFNGRTYIDHRGAKAYSGNSVSWDFTWKAPNGPNGTVVTMYFSSNMANGNGNTSGDKIINSSQSGTIVGGGNPLSVTISSKKNVSCNGGNDGTATASASGGTSPYTYNWSNSNSGAMATMLSAGSYIVTVTDNASATSTASVIITQPSLLTHQLNVVKNVSCNGGKDGSILATAAGGTAPYNFIYSSGSPNNLIAGIYSVTVSDANSCTVSSTVVVNQPDTFSITPVILENPACPLDSNGQIKVTVSGATPPYKYAWSSGEILNQITKKKVGNYKLTITDSKSCSAVRGYELKSTDNQAPNLVAKDSKAYLNQNGIAIPKISDYIVSNTDNCDPSPVMAINIDTFRCNQIGKHNFIISSTDVSGNKAFDTIQIEIFDTIKPVIHVWRDTTIKRCDVIVPSIIATDNCSISEFKRISGPNAGTVFDTGVTVLSYSAKDPSNNLVIDSFKTTIISPIHLTIDSMYFNYCKGDTVFTILSLKHDLHLPMNFIYQKDTTRVLQDSMFTMGATGVDSVHFIVNEESGCKQEFDKSVHYPGFPITLDSFKIKNASDVPDGSIVLFITGGADSISWYNAATNTYVNNTGENLGPGDYIVKAYKGNCEFTYGPFTVITIVSTNNPDIFSLQAYPIPFTDAITIVSDANNELQFELLNGQGNLIENGIFHSKLTISTTHLNPGIYFLKCFGAKKSKTLKLIKL